MSGHEPTRNHEVQLLSDGDGIAVIGESMAVERFLGASGLPSRDLGLPKFSTALRTSAGVAEAGSTMAANSGRWIKLTEKSAQQLKDFTAMKGSAEGVSRAVTMNNGRTNGILEFITKPGPGSMLTNPAVLAGAAGLMAQVAMQQTMDEITDYLAAIDAKVDDVLRAQRDAVVADMIGVDFVIEEAMTIRDQVGLVSEVTWSKVQATSATIARTQAYALLQLDALAEKLERKPAVPDLAKTSKEAEAKVHEWLAVLAPLLPAPGRHRRARARPSPGRFTRRARPAPDRAADRSSEPAGAHRPQHRAPDGAHGRGGRHRQRQGAPAPHRVQGGRERHQPGRRCRRRLPGSPRNRVRSRVLGGQAVDRGRHGGQGKVLATGAEGFDVAKRVGGETLQRAKVVTGRFSSDTAERALRRRRDDE